MRLGMCVLVLVATVSGCVTWPGQQNLPPAERMMCPGPGVGGPGPGVMSFDAGMPSPAQTSQIAFIGPDGMMVNWDASMPGMFDSEPLICPGRYNFPEGQIFRLKLTNVPARPGVELYPTLEVGPAMPRTAAFLSHNAIPVQFSEEDFDQVLSGNYVTKVIYLPDPEYQELALAGVETLVSTRLDPGVDPIVEADRRGAILAIVRLGNLDLQMPADAMQSAQQVMPASYGGPAPGAPMSGAPMGAPSGMVGTTTPANYISGVTGPQYGMPMCGTPIGLPGPPHVPLGAPAGLQQHTMRNHTRTSLPAPTRRMRIDVRQDPGMSYPSPPNRAWIVEQTFPGCGTYQPAMSDYREITTAPGRPCPQ